MTTIYLKVQVPDDYHVGTVNLIPNNKNSSKWSINGNCEEIQLPTQADAMKDCDEYYASLDKDNADLHYFAGEMNIINKLK